MMNLNKLFSLFQSDEDPTPEERNIANNAELVDHPYIYMGLFKKLIINYSTFSEQLFQFMRSSDVNLDVEKMEKTGVHMVYWRAYDHLAKIDLTNSFHVEIIQTYADDKFIQALTMCLQYYEDMEEYEKCAFLKKILDTASFS
jgi:hypothetical protein